MGKVKGNKPQMTPVKKKPIISEQEKAANKAKHKKLIDRSTFLVAFTALALVIIFAGRWLVAITNGYYDTFINYGSSVQEAISSAKGLSLTDDEKSVNLSLEKDWDYFKSSRLCDELQLEKDISLHGYYYDNGSDVTVIYLHQFGEDGTADFLAGNLLYETYGANIFMPDSRGMGESTGGTISYGYKESEDLSDWMEYLESKYGQKEYIIWGCGLGADTALFAESRGLLTGYNVNFIVAESAYPSISTVARRQISKWYTIPAFPAVNFIEMKVNKSDLGYTVSDMNLLTAMESGTADTSVLFLESEGDNYIISDWSSEVYQAYSGDKQIITGSGSHGTVFAEKYDDIKDYIEQMK